MSLVKNKMSENWLPVNFDNMFHPDWLGGTSKENSVGMTVPPVNIQENEDEFLVELAVPGKTKADFNIELNNDVLTISSEEKNENSNNEKRKFTRREFSFKTFKRTFSLPETIDSVKIAANYEQGLLQITLPKKEEAKVQPKRLIEVL